MVAKISDQNVTVVTGTRYPPPYDAPCLQRQRTRLGDAAGLTQFGVNRLNLPPGCWSSQRHWHGAEDECVYVLSGEVAVLEVGSRRPGEDAVEYPDIDLQIPKGQGAYAHRDGRLYDAAPPRR